MISYCLMARGMINQRLCSAGTVDDVVWAFLIVIITECAVDKKILRYANVIEKRQHKRYCNRILPEYQSKSVQI